MKLPTREKYVDEAVGVFIEFGVGSDGTVDVHALGRDVFEGLPKDVAQKVIEAHDRFREELYVILCEGYTR